MSGGAREQMNQRSIRTSNLGKTYSIGQQSVEALRDISLEIPQGQFVSIMGKSGSGKSTLLHLIGGLDRQTTGSVWFGDHDISAMPEKKLSIFRRRHVGFVFQFYNLIPELTLRENIVFPSLLEMNSFDHDTFDKLCETLEITDRLDHRPDQTSGGQQQRAAIARALIMRPDAILLDEPTGNLDNAASQSVLRLLKNLSECWQQTVILVTHDQDAAFMANRVIYIRDGRLV